MIMITEPLSSYKFVSERECVGCGVGVASVRACVRVCKDDATADDDNIGS